ncbi:MAG: hypothetical protein JWQ38_3062 [Flavipsychrobacter sp.]|nr:hypothetical protein [Flavipsychrobacter sp.]
MQKIIALLALSLIPSSTLLAQDATEKVNSSATPPPIVKPSRDFLMLQFTYNNWITKPDSVKTKSFNYGFNGYMCYDFPIKKSHLSFATGAGISTSVIYLNQQVLANTDTGALGGAARFIPDTKTYKRYKFVTAYLQAPFELRYYGNIQNRNKGFKAAVGLQVGTLLGSHTKGLYAVEGTNVKDKINTKRYVSSWNFAATARVGWGNFSLFASYNLTPVFKDNVGPPITPASVGICLTGL